MPRIAYPSESMITFAAPLRFFQAAASCIWERPLGEKGYICFQDLFFVQAPARRLPFLDFGVRKTLRQFIS